MITKEGTEIYQCEGCLSICKAEDTKQPILCNECLDKAASYDSLLLDYVRLRKAVFNNLKELEGEAKGSLQTALELCPERKL